MKEILYNIIRSDRRSVAIRITDDGVQVLAPRRMSRDAIRRFVESKSSWVETQLNKRAEAPSQSSFSPEELERLKRRAAQVIPDRVAHFAKILGVSYGRITIRHQRTRWGSCSSKRNLNFNCLLMLVPSQVLDYVVVHELCHLIEMNHSARFWALVARTLPDYQSHRRWLKDNGSSLVRRLPK